MSETIFSVPRLPSPEEVRRYVTECVETTYRYLADAPGTLKTGRCLYFTACDESTSSNVEAVISTFGSERFDYKVVVYDDHTPAASAFGQCELIRRRGHKWILAKELLVPEICAAYDYIFIWDADIDITLFDVSRFLDLLYRNKLQMAQPSLTPDSYFTWELTVQRPDRPGRFSDFVEIMVPVFSAAAWVTFRDMIRLENNPWGYGYDLFAKSVCEFDAMGIVDCTPVRHLQPVHFRQEALDALEALQQELHPARISNVMSYLTLRSS